MSALPIQRSLHDSTGRRVDNFIQTRENLNNLRTQDSTFSVMKISTIGSRSHRVRPLPKKKLKFLTFI
ncbi:ALTO [Scorpion polyomavirus 3]|nr:ALTO [Scorpion polyomavirus 3]QTH80114.1 ALTO [Scorpion polyomavirus 3]